MFTYPSSTPFAQKVCTYVNTHQNKSCRHIKSQIIKLLLTEAPLCHTPEDTYPHRLEDDAIPSAYRDFCYQSVCREVLSNALAHQAHATRALLFSGSADYSHTLPPWESLLRTGFPGMVKKLTQALSQENLTDEQTDFYQSSLTVYSAILIYLNRLSQSAKEQGKSAIAEIYTHLASSAPQTLSQALAFMVLYYYLQNMLDGIYLRSFGALDHLLLPYYQESLSQGEAAEELDEVMKAFMLRLRDFKHPNNLPFTLGYVTAQGKTLLTPLSYRLLTLYGLLNIQDPKIQIRCGRDVPCDFLSMALELIRKGNNSIVFMNDSVVIPALMKLGIEQADAEAYIPVGCYEPSCHGEIACTCSGRVMLPKAVELTLSDGQDGMSGYSFSKNPLVNDTWEHFYSNLLIRLQTMIDLCMEHINIAEAQYLAFTPSVIFSPTYSSSLEQGRDVYAGGAKYNNSSINVFGIATAVDSLLVIKKLVFDDKTLSARELALILANNWTGYEKLRLQSIKYPEKYGNGSLLADQMTKRLVKDIGSYINGKPNRRGGVFRMGMFSIDWYHEVGLQTGATADGRRAGDIISKNMSPTIGRDRIGVTGVLRSAAAADGHLIPNGTVLDLSIDSSAAYGEDGIRSLTGLVRTFLSSDATALQMNILDPKVLKKARENPAAYSTLQVRLCGWNVYFTQLSDREQEEFIAMAEHLAR